MSSRYWYYLFFADLLAELSALVLHRNDLRLFTKPLLLIILFCWFMTASAGYSTLRFYIAAALFFSWMGDVFLLLDTKTASWFMPGLGSFLVAHACYIAFFLQLRRQLAQKPRNFFIMAVVVLYVISLFVFLYPYTGDLRIPVALYAAALVAMLVTATRAFNKYREPGAWYAVTGAVLFVISDSLLSVNKFYHSFPLADIFIMLSYGLAQFALTKGSLQYLAGEKAGPQPR